MEIAPSTPAIRRSFAIADESRGSDTAPRSRGDLRTLADRVEAVVKERDEARAEVERLNIVEADYDRLCAVHEEDRLARTSDAARQTPALSDPADVPTGELWAVTVGDFPVAGYRDSTERFPWSVIFADDERVNDDYTDSAVTLVSRLVPEVTS